MASCYITLRWQGYYCACPNKRRIVFAAPTRHGALELGFQYSLSSNAAPGSRVDIVDAKDSTVIRRYRAPWR